MDQISDKNREDNWIEELSLNDAMNHLNERENFILRLRLRERHRWKSPREFTSPRHGQLS